MKISELKTLGGILINIQILTVMLISAWLFVPELIESWLDSRFVAFYLISSQLTAIIISFTFSPAALRWDGKAMERAKFLAFAGAYIGIIEVIKWFCTTIEFLT